MRPADKADKSVATQAPVPPGPLYGNRRSYAMARGPFPSGAHQRVGKIQPRPGVACEDVAGWATIAGWIALVVCPGHLNGYLSRFRVQLDGEYRFRGIGAAAAVRPVAMHAGVVEHHADFPAKAVGIGRPHLVLDGITAGHVLISCGVEPCGGQAVRNLLDDVRTVYSNAEGDDPTARTLGTGDRVEGKVHRRLATSNRA